MVQWIRVFLNCNDNETPIGSINDTLVRQFLLVLFLGRLASRISSVDVIDSV